MWLGLLRHAEVSKIVWEYVGGQAGRDVQMELGLLGHAEAAWPVWTYRNTNAFGDIKGWPSFCEHI